MTATVPHQLTFDAGEVILDRRRLSPQQQWELFLDDNPRFVGELVRTLRQLVDAGRRPSINRAFEEMRERIHTVGNEYRLDNTLRAPAARHVINLHPEFADVLRLRRTRR